MPEQNEYKRVLITAALPYANGKIHLGHLAGAYLPADMYARYQRSRKRNVLFICGSDEHGVAITIAADQEHTSPQKLVDRYHALNKAAFEQFGMSFDNYSRTSTPLHHQTASEFFLQLHNAGVLREKREQQLYDATAKMFLPDRYVEGTCPVCANPEARGDQCERCGSYLNPLDLINPKSKITGERPTVRETTHLYFPLGEFQRRLEEYIAAADARDGWKENVLQYCRSWFRDGLQDRAVTRDLQWGVRVPLPAFGDKVIYVWFDAVLGYISGTKEAAAARGQAGLWREFWCDPATKYVAFIGKDNVVFHCIVFPAMLMAWNAGPGKERYILPANVPANEFLNFEGQKFSKSRNWGIDVDEFLAGFPADTLRYTLAMTLPELRDADFTWREFQSRTNNELADILGNFVNRTMTFAHRNFGGVVPPVPAVLPAQCEEVRRAIREAADRAGKLFERYQFRDAVSTVMTLARYANQFFDHQEPWKSIRSNREDCAATINACLHLIRALAILLEPALPFTTQRIWQTLNLAGSPSGDGWDRAGEFVLPSGHTLHTPEILFMKIEDSTIERQREGTAPSAPTSPVSAPAAEPKAEITIDDFKKIDLRVAKVLQAERVPKSEKLVKLQVEIGGEQRQIVAGIAQHYAPEDLVGKKIVVVANLAPAKLMGQESKGMLLAASNPDGKLTILSLDRDIDSGSIVK